MGMSPAEQPLCHGLWTVLLSQRKLNAAGNQYSLSSQVALAGEDSG